MLCEKCKQNPATVHMERTINNIRTEHNLCFQCAAAMNSEMSFDNIIKEFLGSVIGLTNGSSIFSEQREDVGSICPMCGTSFDEFHSEGKLGCAGCYKAFRQQLDAILKNIHGSCEHLGKAPQTASDEILLKRELDQLRRKLKEAIENEEYEAAASLRDHIRGMESAIKGGAENGK